MDLSDTGGCGNMSLGAEIVYGTHEDSHVVMSQKVQSLAGSIYQEFERMIARYDEDVVKTLMPLLVNVLECLDSAYQQNQEHEVELELLREDNEQLVTQYEREKGAKKTAEQKLLEYEDAAEGERKELSSRLEALESIVRMLELKHKNSMEHASRLEEREGELKKEYAKLHERYTDLFKTHVDYMERTKLLHSGQQLANERSNETNRLNSSNRLNLGRSSGPVSFGFASLENADDVTVDSMPSSPISSAHSSPSDINNIPLKVERGQETDSISLANKSVVTSPMSPPPQSQPPNNNHSNHTSTGRIHTKKEQRSANTLYQELSFQDGDGDDDTGDITGGWVHPGEYASSVNDNFYGMGREVENLIMENNELLATKNALNVVKDDLIVQVDELTGELDMLREEILTLNVSRTRLHEKVLSLEEELKKLKEANEAKQDADEEADVLMAQRKRFTRIEMAHVLMERNQYKESFMELQEAVRWTQMLRASKEPQLDKQGGIWGFFQNLFIRKERAHRPLAMPQLSYQVASNQITPGLKPFGRIQDRGEIELGGDRYTTMRRALERREQYRQVRAHVKKDDGRLHAYGWSLPGKVPNPHSIMEKSDGGRSSSGGIPVPVPVYCRPLAETTPEMRIWCAAGVNLMGGYTKDGGLMVGGSVFYSDNTTELSAAINNNVKNQSEESEIESIDRELQNFKDGALLETRLSSLVWICTTTRQASIVTVIDANNPGELLNSFGVCSAQILCIASVPGASPSDYIDEHKPTVYEIWEGDNVQPLEQTDNNPSSEEKSNEDKTPNKTARQLEEQQENAALGKIFFVEKNDTVVNKKDKYKMMYEESMNDDEKQTSEDSNNANNENVDSENKEEKTSSNGGVNPEVDIMSSVLATMWIGDERGNVYVHSSVANWAQRLHTVKLQDAVISIIHVNGRTVVALANSQLVIFKRNSEGEWDLSQYFIVQIGLPTHSVRQLAVVGDKVWCGYRNKIHVLEPRELKIIHSLEAHPRRESPVRQMAWLGEGVWVSIRLDSTLRLYNAHTYEHLQDVDIEPYVSKMLGTGKLGFSLVRITSLLISSNRLWIGTSNGVIISVPLNTSNTHNNMAGSIMCRASNLPGACARIPPMPGSYIPYCSMAHAQLSFHGHRDCVKFFVAVPGNGGVSAASTPSEAMYASQSAASDGPPVPPKSMLVISGGEGYVDFRIGDLDIEESIAKYTQQTLEPQVEPSASSAVVANQEINQRDLSHLIVWQVTTTN